MTESEAIVKFKRTSVLWESASNTEIVEAVKVAISALEEVQQYRAIGTVYEFRELKEKATAKKAKWIFDDFTAKFGNPYRCSNCEEEFGDTYNYCPNCGCDMYAD